MSWLLPTDEPVSQRVIVEIRGPIEMDLQDIMMRVGSIVNRPLRRSHVWMDLSIFGDSVDDSEIVYTVMVPKTGS